VTQPTTETAWTAGELLQQLRRRQKFFVLDVRNRDEFEKFPIEGPGVSTINLPYFEMLESGGKEEMVESVVACIQRDLADKLPRDSPILAVCAKGDTSEFVMQGLQQLGYDSGNLTGGIKAWGNYYESQAILDTPDLSIFQISRPARGCLSYMVISDGKAIVIDPLRHLHPYLDLARARGCSISTIVDTHSHADHISGGLALAAAAGATYNLHPYDAIHPMDLRPATFRYEPICDGQVFHAGKHELRTMHIPGHTLGLVALILDDQYLFSGDSIFIRSIARPDLGGKAEAWAPLHTRSLRKLLEMPEQTTVLPGHFSTLEEADTAGSFQATLRDLKRQNESLLVLQRDSDAGFVRYLLDSLPKFIPEYVDIKRVNTGLLSPAEDDAATLELGKNVCGLAQAQAAVHGESR
jgi:glyoxylase-like metal-dependent hydrolase (beta-lactamase superfamily II)/rhodanese-related sulfurtransferase